MGTLSDRFKNIDQSVQYPKKSQTDSCSPELISLCNKLTKALSTKISSIPIWFDYSKQEQQELIINFLNTRLSEEFSEIHLTAQEKNRIYNVFMNSVYGFGPLDFLLSKKQVSKVLINSHNDILYEYNGEITRAEMTLEEKQFSALITRLCELSGKNSPVITFRFNNLLITILKKPVCNTKLIIKKIDDSCFDFKFFEQRQILNNEITEFFLSIINQQKKILISAPFQCGKTSFLNAFLNETPSNRRILLFEEGSLINTNNKCINRFDTEGLNEKELMELVTAALYYQPDFVFADTNNVDFNLQIPELLPARSCFITSIRANSIQEAVNLCTATKSAKVKCSEKRARIQISKYFDYIIQLEKSDEFFILKSIAEITENNSETPGFNEILTFKEGEYRYKLPAANSVTKNDISKNTQQEPSKPKTKDLTFSERFRV